MLGCQMASSMHKGSSTAVVLRLIKGMVLESANLGDSGFAILRKEPGQPLKTIFMSQPQQFAFNMPY